MRKKLLQNTLFVANEHMADGITVTYLAQR